MPKKHKKTKTHLASKKRFSKGYSALLVSSAIFSSNNYLFKVVLRTIPTAPFLAVRHVVSGLLLLPFAAKRWHKMHVKDFARIAILAMLTISVSNGLWAEGAKRSSLLLTGILSVLSPLFTYLFAVLLLKERLTKRAIVAASISFLGTGVLVLAPMIVTGSISFSRSVAGPLLILLANVVGAYATIASKKTLRRVDPLQFTVIESFFGVIPMIIIMLAQGSWTAFGQASTSTLLIVGLLASTNGAGAFYLFNYGIKRVHADVAAEQNYLQTLFVCAIAVMLGERVSASFLVGGTLIIIGTLVNHTHVRRVWWMQHLSVPHIDVKKYLKAPELAFDYVVQKTKNY